MLTVLGLTVKKVSHLILVLLPLCLEGWVSSSTYYLYVFTELTYSHHMLLIWAIFIIYNSKGTHVYLTCFTLSGVFRTNHHRFTQFSLITARVALHHLNMLWRLILFRYGQFQCFPYYAVIKTMLCIVSNTYVLDFFQLYRICTEESSSWNECEHVVCVCAWARMYAQFYKLFYVLMQTSINLQCHSTPFAQNHLEWSNINMFENVTQERRC